MMDEMEKENSANNISDTIYCLLKLTDIDETAYYQTQNHDARVGDRITISGMEGQEEPISGEIVSVDDHMEFPNSFPDRGFLLITDDNFTRIEFPFQYMKADDGLRIFMYQKINGVKEVVIPDSIEGEKVVEIGDYAFYNQSELEKIVLPDGITNLGRGTFAFCTNLKSINLPDSLKSMSESVRTWFSENLEKKFKESTLQQIGTFTGCEGLSKITIPDSVDHIGPYCFSQCKNLRKIVLPDSLTCLETGLLNQCSSLRFIHFPKQLEAVKEQACLFCSNLTEMKLPEGLQDLRSGCFRDCTNLEKVYIPNSVTRIDRDVFEDDNLTIFCDTGSYAYQYAEENGINHAKGEFYFESNQEEVDKEQNETEPSAEEMKNNSMINRDPIEIIVDLNKRDQKQKSEQEEIPPVGTAIVVHIHVDSDSLAKFGLKDVNAGATDINFYDGHLGMELFFEIISEPGFKAEGTVQMIINVYDKTNRFITAGTMDIDLEKFSGHETFWVKVFHEKIYQVAEVKAYLSDSLIIGEGD